MSDDSPAKTLLHFLHHMRPVSPEPLGIEVLTTNNRVEDLDSVFAELLDSPPPPNPRDAQIEESITKLQKFSAGLLASINIGMHYALHFCYDNGLPEGAFIELVSFMCRGIQTSQALHGGLAEELCTLAGLTEYADPGYVPMLVQKRLDADRKFVDPRKLVDHDALHATVDLAAHSMSFVWADYNFDPEMLRDYYFQHRTETEGN